MNSEQIILSNILFYDTARHYLPQINKNWFTDKLSVKLVDVMTKMYYSDEVIDYITLQPHFNRTELIQIVELQQNASGISDIKPHLKKLEYDYIRTKLVYDITKIDIHADLEDIVKSLQKALNDTAFTSKKEPENIIRVTNKVVDNLIDISQNKGNVKGKKTGWLFLDKYLGGYNEGDLIVVAGRPGMGKTAIALTFMVEFVKQGGKGLFVGLEMSNEQLAKRYLSLIGNFENWKMRNGVLNKTEQEKIIDLANNQQIQFYLDDDPKGDLENIKAKARLHKSKHGLDLLVIDYIQLMTGTKQSREQEIAEISRGLKLLAKELKCTVMVLAQLSRKPEERADKRPLLSDLRESGAIEQDADVVLFPFRPSYYEQEQPIVEESELIIGKNRNGECATIPTTFEGRFTMYKENIAPKVQSPFEF